MDHGGSNTWDRLADDITMGLLVPEDFPLSLLANDDERIVVEALRDRLSDDG